jgi:hypothetical protein
VLIWDVVLDPEDEPVCGGVISGGEKVYVVTQKLCTEQIHIKANVQLMPLWIYLLVGDACNHRRYAALLGLSVPAEIFADRWLEVTGLSLSRT